MAIFTGSGVALVTPFDQNNQVNFDKLQELIEYHIKNSTDAVIVVGTTGEGSTLSEEEHAEVIRQSVAIAAGRIPIIAGTGSNCTETAIQLSKGADRDGADAVLVVTPYYNKATQKGMIRHYTAIAQAINIPMIMYNIPGRTGCKMSAETMAALINGVDNIVGVKEATSDLELAAKTMLLTNGDCELYSGEDALVVPLLSIGGQGVISVIANIAPQETHDMVMEYLQGDRKKAAQMQLEALPLIDALFSEVNPIPVKHAMNVMGMNVGSLRAPLYEMEPETAAKLEAEMQKYGVQAW